MVTRWDEYIALSLILCSAIYFFWTGRLRTDLTALLVMLGLILPWPHADGGWRAILTYREGFSGFGSAAVVMVAAMFVVGAAIIRTGLVEFLGGRLFRACAHSEVLLQFVILSLTTCVSMFVNDTTVVLVFLPTIITLCKERNLSPSRYLLCAAYGSLLGGQWTLIGTRSNIVISDYLLQKSGAGLGFFDFTVVAAAVFAVCAVYFLLIGRRFLPKASETRLLDNVVGRNYLTEVTVTEQSRAVGKALGEWSWGKRANVAILEVIRGPERMPAYPQLRLQAGDVLIMNGPASTMAELLQTPDFTLKQELEIGEKTLRNVDLVTVEALIAPTSNYAASTLEEMDFGPDFGFTVMGIARRGAAIHERPMATPLRYGDSLLLLGHISGLDRLRDNPNLILLEQRMFPPMDKRKALLIALLLLGVIGMAIGGLLSPAISIPLAAMLAILFRCVRFQELYHVVDWPSVVTIAGMIPFGLALEKSGAAAAIAQTIAHTFTPYGPIIVLGALLLVAIVLTQLIENAAVAIVLAPIAYRIALEGGLDPKPFLVGLAICVSAAFCSPVAHESTILVMGPGQYRFRHYLQIGVAMAILTWLLAVWITPLIWPFKPAG
jgi:di/tricarboxylate transporter